LGRSEREVLFIKIALPFLFLFKFLPHLFMGITMSVFAHYEMAFQKFISKAPKGRVVPDKCRETK